MIMKDSGLKDVFVRNEFRINRIMKEKIELEYTLNTSPKVLFPRLSTPSGLAEWFSDNVNMIGNVYIFIWDGSEEKAEIVHLRENKSIRFRWIDEDDCCDDNFFEFRINQEELTKSIALIITDFVDADEKDGAIELWDSQINVLKRILGL